MILAKLVLIVLALIVLAWMIGGALRNFRR
jgi:hypothetical protein